MITYSFAQILSRLFAFYPSKLFYWLSDGLFFLLFYVFQYRRSVIQRHLRDSFPTFTPSRRATIEKAFYRQFADVILESIQGMTMTKSELLRRYEYVNPAVLNQAFNQHSKIILCGSHLCNWEWGGMTFPLVVEGTVFGIYKPLTNSGLDQWLKERRSRFGLQLTPMGHIIRKMMQKQDQPAVFVFIADQTPSNIDEAHWVSFLHQPTPFHPGVDRLARKTGYPVFQYEIQRVKRGHYQVFFEEIVSDPKSHSTGGITKVFAQKLEAQIQQNPSDWLWTHKRWKHKHKWTRNP